MSSYDFTGLMKSLNLDESQFKQYSTDFDKLDFKELSQLKGEIESQLSILFDILSSQYHADMDTKLVTVDGFPRADIDVVSVRLIRVKIIRLRNDHKQVLKHLEEKLIGEFASRKSTTVEEEHHNGQVKTTGPIHTIPFAEVKQVVANGPADKSGLKEGDRIIVFDKNIYVTNHQNLSSLATRVRSRVDQEIEVEITRDGKRTTVTLVPTNNWDGQGLLGCRVVPL